MVFEGHVVVSFVEPELTTNNPKVRDGCFVRKAWTYNLQTKRKFCVSEVVVSIVQPDLTTYRHKSPHTLSNIVHQACETRPKRFCNLREWITLFVIPK